MRTLKQLIFWVVCSSCFSFALGQQTPYLEKLVSLRQSTITYNDLFKQLSAQTGVVFSYTNFDDSQKITIQYYKKPLRVVLNDALNEGNCTYKMKGKYVILACKSSPKKVEQSSSDVIVNGYVYSASDSTLMPETSVYLKQYRQSAITNEYGYFSLSFPKSSDVLSISVAKENFEDTTVVILSKKRNTIVIYLQPKAPLTTIVVDPINRIDPEVESDTIRSAIVEDTIINPPFSFWERFRERQSNLRNIRDTFFTNYSFSFVPPLSTNHLLAVNTINRYSFNALVGFSHGVDVLEIGGILNLDYGNVQSVQIGGIANLVSGNVHGLQLSGIVNTVGGNVDGVQVGGIVNVVGGNLNKVQLAGIGNTVFGYTNGVQVAGIYNFNWKNVQGVQVAGIANYAPSFNGCQISGIANGVWRKSFGTQISGILNLADSIQGVQLSGMVNAARYIKGWQISGFINVAKSVEGSQLGFLNVADTVSGVPIGWLSFVRKGYHKIEVASDENLMNTLSFRTGVNAFHNIFTAGTQFTGNDRLWTIGYGLGSSIRLCKKWYLDIDATSQQLNFQGSGKVSYNMLGKVYFGAEWRLTNYFSIAAGPTLNWLNADISSSDYQLVQDRLSVKPFYSSIGSNFANQLWVGGRVAIRFF